jgi:hypothetical protein
MYVGCRKQRCMQQNKPQHRRASGAPMTYQEYSVVRNVIIGDCACRFRLTIFGIVLCMESVTKIKFIRCLTSDSSTSSLPHGNQDTSFPGEEDGGCCFQKIKHHCRILFSPICLCRTNVRDSGIPMDKLNGIVSRSNGLDLVDELPIHINR